jgi:lipopolysaccharide export system permease protein
MSDSTFSAESCTAILFITSNSLGDAVLSTGILGWLMETHKEARLTVVAGLLHAPLFTMAPGIHTVIPLRKKPWSRHWLDLWLDLRGQQWDLIVDLRNTAVSRLLRARKRIVFPGSAKPIPKSVQLARLFGISPPPLPRLWLTPDIQAAGDSLLATDRASTLSPLLAPILALAPAANWAGKQWPPERFAALALALTAENGILPHGRIAIFAAHHERAQLAQLYEALARSTFPPGRVIDLVGRTDIALAAACLARAKLFIGNDSGPMHMAAALGVPTLGLFGHSDERVYGPQGPNTAAIRTPESLVELQKLRAPGLMLSLGAPEVQAAAERLFKAADRTP